MDDWKRCRHCGQIASRDHNDCRPTLGMWLLALFLLAAFIAWCYHPTPIHYNGSLPRPW